MEDDKAQDCQNGTFETASSNSCPYGSLDSLSGQGCDGNSANYTQARNDFDQVGALTGVDSRLGNNSIELLHRDEDAPSGLAVPKIGISGMNLNGNSEDFDADDDDSRDGCDSSDWGDRNYPSGYVVNSEPVEFENHLSMSNSEAFGINDWNDFEDSGSGNLAIHELNLFDNKYRETFVDSTKLFMIENPNVSLWDNINENVEEKRILPVDQYQSREADDMFGASLTAEESNNLKKAIEGTTKSLYDFRAECDLYLEGFGDNSISCNWNHASGESCASLPIYEPASKEPDPLLASVSLPVDNPSQSATSNDSIRSIYNPKDSGLEIIMDSKPLSVVNDGNCVTSVPRAESNSHSLSQNITDLPLVEKREVNGFYDEIVREMEEILLDSGGPRMSKFLPKVRTMDSPSTLPLRDGSLTASTSGNEGDFSQSMRIDGVEVIGAKQKKGDVSFSERLVGVKEYTVYVIRVWSNQDHWIVERRYREFYALYCKLKAYFTDHGWRLPTPWTCIEQESRKIFGSASPDVVYERSAIIQECLQSIVQSGLFPSIPGELHCFLGQPGSLPTSPAISSDTNIFFSEKIGKSETIPPLGKTISLLVEVQPHKPVKQILEAQQNRCAGCHIPFDDKINIIRGFIQTLGWGNPRLCDYTGQLFCSSCHVNDYAILPARVLHHWDFTHYPVSQLAKSYLQSINEQPMLCVSAVNPFLYAKVPALQHVASLRKRLASIVTFVKCPFRTVINKALGSRKYLLESNDFFALRDLIDLSRGSFAALPALLENAARKITEHIIENCLICYDVGVPCGARHACCNSSTLVFPFQEDEMEKCKSCGSVFHKLCFAKVGRCPCKPDSDVAFSNKLIQTSSHSLLGSPRLRGWLPARMFSKPLFDHPQDDHGNENVILMGSLPSANFY